MVSHLKLFKSEHRKMGIALNSDFWQMNYGNISAMFIYHIPPPFGHYQGGPPLVFAGVWCGFIGILSP